MFNARNRPSTLSKLRTVAAHIVEESEREQKQEKAQQVAIKDEAECDFAVDMFKVPLFCPLFERVL